MTGTFSDGQPRGVALVATLLAMLVIGALVSSVLLVALHEQRVAAGSPRRLQAFLAAESGLNTVVESWTPRRYRSITLGAARSVSQWLADSSGWFRGVVRPTGADMYLVDIEGFSSDSTFRQHLGKLISLVTPAVSVSGALTAMSPVVFGPDVTISGTADAGCPGSPMGAGLIVSDSGGVSGSPNLSGAPPLLVDSGLATWFATELWWVGQNSSVLRAADYVLDGGTFYPGGALLPYDTCNARDVSWRTDTSVCSGEFPVIVVRGDATFSGQVSRGLLVVLGDARITESLEFTGLMVVRGRLTSVPDPGLRVVVGAILVEDSAGLGTSLDGHWTVGFSRCAVRDALAGLVIPHRLKHRSWANLY